MKSMSRFTRTICLPLLLGLLAAPAMAQEEEDAVAQLLKADAATFSDLAARDEPDPWLVAGRLAAADRWDMALRFARAKPRPAVDGLPAFLETKPAFDEHIGQVQESIVVRLEDDYGRS